MERENSNGGLVGRPKGLGRPLNPLEIREDGRRPLFGNANGNRGGENTSANPRTRENPSKEVYEPSSGRAKHALWRTMSEPQTQRPASTSPGGTRIPQLKGTNTNSSPRRQLSLAEAMVLAGSDDEQDLGGSDSEPVADGSPSPAPKSTRGASDRMRRLTNGSDGPMSRDWRSRAASNARHRSAKPNDKSDDNDLPALAPGIDIPLPSIETGNSLTSSPIKNFAWDIDQDFTAGEDLQISNSPRLKTDRPFANRLAFDDDSSLDIASSARLNPGSQNTKLDKIRAREAQAAEHSSLFDHSQDRPTYSRLDEIRAREKQVEAEYSALETNGPRPKNTKLDEIRQREQNGLSNRAFAQAKLEEIRDQNSGSRSKSPEETRPKTSDKRGTSESRIPVRSREGEENDGAVPTPKRMDLNPKASDFTPSAHARSDSRELLRRLARATSSSPVTGPLPRIRTSPTKTDNRGEKTLRDQPGAGSRLSNRPPRQPDNTRRSNIRNKDLEKRPTVGFAGLRRVRSTESTRSKRSSLHSEADPTDRIHSEQRLFAPLDNHSERGSVRAPSVAADSDDDDLAEATPRAKKQDPLAMPTPRVVGAYVETPATVRAIKYEDTDEERTPTVRMLKERVPSFAKRNKDREVLSDPGDEEEVDGAKEKKKRRPRPRARSLPRIDLPRIELPSAKADLRELQLRHNIEDSTLDDFDDIISGMKHPAGVVEDAFTEEGGKLEKKLDFESDFEEPLESQPSTRKSSSEFASQKDEPEFPTEPETFDRMTNLLLGIRDSKRGIGRLGDQVSRIMEEKQQQQQQLQQEKPALLISDAHVHTREHEQDPQQACPICVPASSSKNVTYIHIAVPSFRSLRVLIFTLMLPLLWLAVESSMCALYCRPETCVSDPCIWSFDDPTFGTAVPVKLDQWATNGAGRKWANHAYEEIQDWVADVMDTVYDRDIRDTDVLQLSMEGKKSYRRRLRKRGLLSSDFKVDDRAQREKLENWRRARLARERVKDARELGYELEEEESVGGDRRVR